jgi:cytochrome P450
MSEVLRLVGPIPSAAPRVSPGKLIAGKFVPAGTIVSNVPYSTHRDPSVWPNPIVFDPDRWENPTPEMKMMFRPFQTGPRNCVGVHLAKIQLLLTVCRLYQRFDVTVDYVKTTEEMMVMRDQGLMTASGEQLWVEIKPREP